VNDTDYFEPFDLNVLIVGNPQEVWLSASSRLGAVNAFRADTDAVSIADLTTGADWFGDHIRDGRPGREKAIEYGGQLRDLLFGIDEIASLFRRTRGAAAAQRRPIAVRLLAAPEHVAALPWELLLDPDDGVTPLVFAPDAHLVRVARDRRYPLRVDLIAPPLNVLLVLSNPATTSVDEVPFDHYEEGRALMGELQPLVDRGVLSVDIEDRPSVENLRRRMGARERGYHVVHYLGHARPDALKLEDGDGAIRWESSEKFNDLLRSCPDLRLVFFAGCRTASLPPSATPAAVGDTSSAARFASSLSIADRCVRDVSQTVLGMQAVLAFRSEQILTKFFYQGLCAGSSVARALSMARAAVREDDVVGGDLLDWAVPQLVTGHIPGPILDPEARTSVVPRKATPRVQLKLELAEPDREFFARFAQLRDALSVLGRWTPERVLWVTGDPGSGKSRLLARALDELDSSISVLYVSAKRLSRPSGGKVPDTIAELCELVAEVLERSDHRTPKVDASWSPMEWWDRLIEELVETPFVLAIDDLDRLDATGPEPLAEAVERLIGRVSKARVVFASRDLPDAILSKHVLALTKIVRVPSLEYKEVEQWIQRNRPALWAALNGLPTSDKGAIWSKFGPRLYMWSRLAAELAGQVVKDLDQAVAVVAAWDKKAATTTTPPPIAASAAGLFVTASPVMTPTSAPVDAGAGPLRVAIAGPFTQGRQQQFAEAITTLAIEFDVGTRAVVAGGADASTASAALLPIESPFCKTENGIEEGVMPDEIVEWLKVVRDERADIVALDYGSEQQTPAEKQLIAEMVNNGALVLAAGGNTGKAAYPAWYPSVVAIGAIGENDEVAPYSPYISKKSKPDLYDLETVFGTKMEAVLVSAGPQTKGTSFAMLNTVGAAVLVWSVDRTQTAAQVRDVLVGTATPFSKRRGKKPIRVNLRAAIERARLGLLANHLTGRGLDVQAASMASGLEANMTGELLGKLVSDPSLVKQHVVQEGDRYVANSVS
jgi:CHAT domain/AAA ATPase domain/Subtilase family